VREDTRGKIQKPKSKFQIKSKSQNPRNAEILCGGSRQDRICCSIRPANYLSKMKLSSPGSNYVIGYWNLGFIWILEFGNWNLN
jgi:hypothetical protein